MSGGFSISLPSRRRRERKRERKKKERRAEKQRVGMVEGNAGRSLALMNK